MNNAPFYVGQRVVCLSTSGEFVKDKIYVVEEMFTCPGCSHWHTILINTRETFSNQYPCDCGEWVETISTRFGGDVKWFVPVQYADITASLAAKATVEETADQPVKHIVNN